MLLTLVLLVELVEIVEFVLFFSVWLVLKLESHTVLVVIPSWSPCWMVERPPLIFLYFWHISQINFPVFLGL